MGIKVLVWPVILFLALLSLFAIGAVPAYWTLMFAVIFIVVGFVVGVLLLGSGRENMPMGITMLALGIILFLIVYFFPR